MASERKIIISADSGPIESAFESIGARGKAAFDKVTDSAEKVTKATDGLGDSVSSKFSKIEKEAAMAFKELLSDSEKYTTNVRERSKYLESEIKQLERINRQEKQRSDAEAKIRYKKETNSLGRASFRSDDREKAKEKYLQELQDNETKSRMSDIQIASIREKKTHYDRRSRELEEGDDDDEEGGSKRSRGGNYVGRKVSAAGGIISSIAQGVAQGLGFGAVLSVGGFVGKMIQEGESLQKAQARSGAMGIRGGSVAGLKTADQLEYSKNVALQAGYGDVRGLATDQGKIERGTGMDLGSMNSFHTVMRSEGQSGKTLVDSTVEMLSIMKKSGLYGISKGDFTMTHELLERQNTLNELQANQSESISSRTSSQLMAAFGAIGGSFGDQRQNQTLGSINNSITNPGNDFKKAFILRSIKNQNPNASLLEMMTDQEKGIFKEGQFENIMKDLGSTFKGDQRVFSVSKMFGLKLSQAKHLTEQFDANPGAFSNVGSEEDLKGMITPGSLAKRGGVSTMEQKRAEFDDWFAKKGSGAINTVSSWMKAYDKDGVGGLGKKMFDDMSHAIVSAFKEGAKIVKESITDAKEKILAGTLFGAPAEVDKESQSRISSIASKLVRGNLVGDDKLDAADREKKKKLLAEIESGSGEYHPNSSMGANEILDLAKSRNAFLFSSGEASKRSVVRGETEDKASQFIDNDVLKGMSNTLEISKAKDNFIKLSKEFPGGFYRLKKEFEDNNGEIKMDDLGAGKGSNELLKVMKELVEIQKRSLDIKKSSEHVENYSTKSVN